LYSFDSNKYYMIIINLIYINSLVH